MFDYTPHLVVPVSERDHAQGPSDAPVTLVEYGDYESAECGQLYPIVKQIQAECGPALRFVFRHFPLTQRHRYAEHAAEAAEAAGTQRAFWAMHDLLFASQGRLDDASLIRYATMVVNDMERFLQEFTTGALHKRVRDERAGGDRSGINRMPNFYINGLRYDGAHEYDALLAAIADARSRARPDS